MLTPCLSGVGVAKSGLDTVWERHKMTLIKLPGCGFPTLCDLCFMASGTYLDVNCV